MRQLTVLVIVCWLGLEAPQVGMAALLDFEDLTSQFRENEAKPPLNIGSFYAGVDFGPYVVGLTSPHYDDVLYPPHSGTTVVTALNQTPNTPDQLADSLILFSIPMPYLSAWFTTSGRHGLTFEVLDSSGGLLNSQHLAGNLTGNSRFFYDSPISNISALRIHALENHWIMDDLYFGGRSGDPSGVIPEPQSMFLLGLGLLVSLGHWRREKRLRE